MCIHTDIPLMIVLSVRTPNSLEMKKIEIHIRNKLFNEFHRQLVFVVCKGAEFPILAFTLSIKIC